MSGGIDISGDGGLAFTETVDGGGGGKILWLTLFYKMN